MIVIIFRVYCSFLVFYPIHLWSTTIQIYFITFSLQLISMIKNKLLPFISLSISIWYLDKTNTKSSSIKSYTWSLIIISAITLWMHYAVFISIFRKLIKSIEFSMYQIFWDYLWYFSSVIWFHWNILQLIVFYFYHQYFHIQYDYYYKIY